MSEHKFYSLPTEPGQHLILGQITSAAYSIECAMIIDHYPGPVMIIAVDTHNALQLYYEIRQLTHHPILTLLDWGSLPYDHCSPSQEVISERLSTFYSLSNLTRGAIVLSVHTLMQRVCPHNFLYYNTIKIVKGQYLSLNLLHTQLNKAGYHKVDQVIGHGEFSIHGYLLDIYPMGSKEPYRITFLNNKINELYIFDVDTQRTFQEASDITCFPVHEFPTDKSGIELFRNHWRKYFDIRRDVEYIYQQISEDVLPVGIEYWQPLFFNEPLVSLFSYLSIKMLLVILGDLTTSANFFWKDISMRFESKVVDPMRPPLSPKMLWLQVDDLFYEMKKYPRVQISTKKIKKQDGQKNMNYQPLPNIKMEVKSNTPLKKLSQFCNDFNDQIIFSVENEDRRDILSSLLVQINIHLKKIKTLQDANEKGSYIIISANKHGVIDALRNRALICERDWLGERINSRQQANHHKINVDMVIRNLAELHKNQPVIHLEHGVGRYFGMTTFKVSGIESEYLILNYANNDKLYVPVSSFHLVSRYVSGSDRKVPLHKLGGDTWTQARKKATERIQDTAAELLDIYTQRASKSGFAFSYNKQNYQIFCESFPFEITPDQSRVLNEVLNDMCQPLVMDRLICGGVGFGKTEIAMRAAFLAIENKKQVAVLVPNTLLAQQHFDNFKNRFANFAVHIEMISRFRSTCDQTRILNQTATGKVNILIGTHKLLQHNLKWYDLGLLIIDEEHRFGVRHKESIKSVHANIDILTLTATPIPRTLNMAMNKIRDLSIINTPPARRLAVRTFIHEYDHLVVREAIIREISRGGQVYYLHNEIENIEHTVHQLATLVPEARIDIAHGKMRERNLERVMSDFYHQRFNVLVCTTIIETGIDIANVNTIIIERADHFGLAQLHQLQGRVGRSHHQAYAYLLTPPMVEMTKNAYKRLEAVASLEDLGAGFALATHDLEIRGAGELLGKDQSGQMETIGFSLYMNMLESALDAMKAGHQPTFDNLTRQITNLELHIPMLLPEKYIPNVNTRLSFYKRISSATDDHEIEELKVELVDRFGLLPTPARYLLIIAKLKQKAQSLGIRRIEGNNKGGFIEFSETGRRIDPNYLLYLLKHNADIYQIESPIRLKFVCDLTDHMVRLSYIDQLLTEFQQHTLNI